MIKRATLATLLVALGLGFAGVSSAGAAAPGGLSALPNPLGCLRAGTAGCGALHDGAGAYGFVLSPDGKNAYATAWYDSSVTAYDRDPNTGALTQKAGQGGCIHNGAATATCGAGHFLGSPLGIAINKAGTHVYVAAASANAVLIFDRDPSTGVLTQKPDDLGCIATGNAQCRAGRAITSSYEVALSPDDQYLYVTSNGGSSVTAMHVESDGTLNQVNDAAGKFGCVVDSGAANPSGCLTRDGLGGAWGLAISPDGNNVYVGGFSDATLITLNRDPANGRLTAPTATGSCFDRDAGTASCTTLPELGGTWDLLASPDGKRVYFPTDSGQKVVVFDRAGSGLLTRHPGATGCVSAAVAANCAVGRLVDPRGVGLSPDGAHLYVTSGTGRLTEQTVTADGGIAPRLDTAGCFANPAAAGCQTATGPLTGASAPTVSADGRFVYVGAAEAQSVAVFKRDSAGPVCTNGTITVPAGSVGPLPLPCSDIDGDPFNVSIINPPTLGSLGAIDNAAHTIVYAAPQGQSGTTTLTFKASYPNGSFETTGSLTVTVVGSGVSPATNPPLPPGRITITLGFAFSASTNKQTKFTSLTVKGFPSGSTITVTCIKGTCPSSLVTKKKVKKKTKLVSKPLVVKNAKGTVKLSKVIKKALRAGTQIRISVTKPGMIGASKLLTVGKRKAPKVTTFCLPVGSNSPQTICS
jgi:DNA-binding beta-propeller fold protein YncE